MPATRSVCRHITRSQSCRRARRCVWTAVWPNTWTSTRGWGVSWRSSLSRMRSWWGKQLSGADKDCWWREWRGAWRGGGGVVERQCWNIWLSVLLWQTSSFPGEEDTAKTPEERRHYLFYVRFCDCFQLCGGRGGWSRNNASVWAGSNTQIMSSLDSNLPLSCFFCPAWSEVNILFRC